MPLLTLEEARRVGQSEATILRKTATAALNESRQTTRTSFDVFLSHSRLDAEAILGVKRILERAGKSVYVDWIDDPQLDRSNVTAGTAEQLRRRMRQSRSLFYVHSGNAARSRWMPWELGYFDGFNGNVAILPLVGVTNVTEFRGEEFLGLYGYVDVSNGVIYIRRNRFTAASFEIWRSQTDKLRPTA